MNDQLLYGVAVLVALLMIYHVWFRPEYLTDDEIAQSLLARAMLTDPADSTAVIKSMPLLERKRYEHLSGLPYNPNYYREHMVELPYNPNFYREHMVELPYNPNFYREHMSNKFVMSMNA
jgi:hypothetical protein